MVVRSTQLRHDKILVLSIVAYFLFLGTLWGLYSMGTPTQVKVTIYDQISRSGGAVEIAAKFERDGPGLLNPDLHEISVELQLGDGKAQPPAQVKTDREGIGRCAVDAPDEPGFHALRARPTDARKYRARRHEPAGLFVLRPDTPILICDIDDTITEGGGYKLFVPGKEPRPRPGAASELTRLAQRYEIIFLTARDDALLDVTRKWLRLHGFPRAPVVGRDWNVMSPLTTGKDKRTTLEAWRKRFGPIAWGIGNSSGDQEAYTGVGIPHIMLGRKFEPEKDAAVRSWGVMNWTEVGSIIGKESPESTPAPSGEPRKEG